MSGRSAYVRKKITETKGEKGVLSRSRTKSSISSDEATISEFAASSRQDTGVGTTNARLLKFSEPLRENETIEYRGDVSYVGHGGDSVSGGSNDGPREPVGTPQFKGPLEDFAYARARKPAIKTEDVSGIEKSGLRSVLDKKSEEVRKGLAKTFAFGKKNKRIDPERGLEFRPQSAATVRPHQPIYASDLEAECEPTPEAQLQHPQQQQQLQQHQYSQHQHQHQHQHQQQEHQFPDRVSGMSPGMASPPPSARLPPVPPAATTPPIKRWIGAGRPVQRWNKLRKDPELWDPNGDVLVFLSDRSQGPRANPSFRLSSHIIEATESRYLITLLRDGSTEEDIHMPPLPVGAPPMLQRRGMAGADHRMQEHHFAAPSAYFRGGQPTPPISEDASLGDADGQISYEMYFPTPPNMTKMDQIRHHITTRNLFALLYHASLVGLSLCQALSDLHDRLEKYMPPEADNVGTIINYLSARGIDDVRNDAETAVSLLAWSEGHSVRWDEGWRESFLHCAGMYARLEHCADFKNIAPITRALLERACLETQLRVQAAEERLGEFQYTDMWPPTVASGSSSGLVTASPAKASADRLQNFLIAHYTGVYGRWPPSQPTHHGPDLGHVEEDMWLTRTIAQALQKDFAALYDYLVDRDIVWDGSEARSSRKWMMVSEGGNRTFEADTPDLPMTDMLIEFDNKLRFPHIPHPYPLVPDSIPAVMGESGADGGKERPSTLRKDNGVSLRGNATAGKLGALERRVQLAYTDATNIYVLGSEFTQSDLVDSFVKFEKADGVGQVDPSIARRGRWVLVYGVLQTLASISVDAPNVRYRDGVTYHLCPRLKGAKIPPWKAGSPSTLHGGGDSSSNEEAAHELSHCWAIVRSWAGVASNSGTDTSAASSGGSGNASPVVRAAYAFPRPPPTTTSRSSVAGYYTPAGPRSLRSSNSSVAPSVSAYPPFSSAGSVISESDTASSVRSPGSLSRRATKSRDGLSGKTGGGLRGLTTFGGGFERVDEVDSLEPGRARRPTGSVDTSGGILALEMAEDSARDSFGTALGGHGSGAWDGKERGFTGSGLDTGRSLVGGPEIRDFDDLDVIDDHDP